MCREHCFIYPRAVTGVQFSVSFTQKYKVQPRTVNLNRNSQLKLSSHKTEVGLKAKIGNKNRKTCIDPFFPQICLEMRSLERFHQKFLSFLH